MTITRELGCTPQENHRKPKCEDAGEVHFVKDCTNYYSGGWDNYGLINDAFGWNMSYLIVEEYEANVDDMWWWGGCSSSNLINATAYLLDEACHTNLAGTTSTKLTLGHSLFITKYDDPDCTTAVNKTEVTLAMINRGLCVDNARRLYLGGPRLRMTAVAIFEDSSCTETPVRIKFTVDFMCGAERDHAKTVCGRDGESLYSISNCTNDYAGLSSTVFGNNTPYIIMEEFSTTSCNWQAQKTTVYLADGACHSNTDDATSFKATLTTAGTATIATYSDTYCNVPQDNITVSKQMFTLYQCVDGQGCIPENEYGCSRRFSVGGVDISMRTSVLKAVAVYDDKDFSTLPVVLAAYPVRTCSIETTSKCQKIDTWAYALYQEPESIDDLAAFSASKFGSGPYLIMEYYASETNCQTLKSAVVYKADGKCHPKVSDDTFFKITPGFGNSVTIASYPTSICSDFDAEYVTVGTKLINTGRCFKGNQRLYANMSSLFTPSPPLMVDVESMTREQIMFPEWLWEPTPRQIFQSD
ncbi:unnamed protein product [Phytophthora fragariaefolia]|uniref:Unnamed protein product n=1 Tax=Phytophthora fragariaefolia TaxID=1490495 RepID=A0A9W6TXA7_9STRA|nr:unnamed protein product [Phytophthora fragariaefolia]